MTNDPVPGQDDRDAIEFQQFYEDKYDDLIAYVCRHWPYVDPQSIVDETMTRVWRHRHKIHGERMGYATVTARNLVMDAFRQPPEFLLEPNEIHERLAGTETPVDPDDAVVHRVEAALRRLPAHLQTAMRLYLNDLDQEQIAHEMNSKVASVSQYLSRARKLMAEDLGRRPRHRKRGAREDPVATNPTPGHHQDEED